MLNVLQSYVRQCGLYVFPILHIIYFSFFLFLCPIRRDRKTFSRSKEETKKLDGKSENEGTKKKHGKENSNIVKVHTHMSVLCALDFLCCCCYMVRALTGQQQL